VGRRNHLILTVNLIIGLLSKHGYIGVKIVSKDQAIGGLIFLVCVVVIIGYILGMFFYDPWIKDWLADSLNIAWSTGGVRYWLVAVPVLVAFVAVLGIGAWIGWTMATTPPPKPIEEIEAEEKKEEAKAEGEEKASEKASEKKK